MDKKGRGTILNCLKLTIHTILQSYRKFIFSSIGIGIGVFSLILIQMLSSYTINTFNDQLTKLGVDGILITTTTSGLDFTSDYVTEIDSLDCVREIGPFAQQNVQVVGSKNKMTVFGVEHNFLDIYGLEMLHGRVFSDMSSEDICIIDSQLADELFATANCIGNSLYVKMGNQSITLKISGVIKGEDELTKGLTESLDLRSIYIPYHTLARYQNVSGMNQFIIITDDSYPLDTTVARIETVSKKNFGMDEYEIQNLSSQKNQIMNLLQIVKNCLYAIGAVSILVSVTSVFNTMLMKVNEQKREIGIKKAIGATNLSIMLDFLCESSIIFIVGCLIGTALSFIIFLLLNAFVSSAFTFDLSFCIIVFAVGFVLGVISGIYPSWKAAKLKPVDTIYQN